jgi:hypothetical protein
MQPAHSLFGPEVTAAPPPTLSKRGFAEAIGVSQARVSQMVGAGLPVEPNGRIDPAKGRAWVAANVDPNRRRAMADHEVLDLPGVPLSAKREREAADAMTARLKAEKLAGNLLDRSAALRAIEGRARMDRDRWVAWVNRAAPELANALGVDLAPVVGLLDRLVREQLAALAETPIEGVTE